jgi:hypothetical protein
MGHRKTFKINNKIYVSAGIILYTVDNGIYNFLLQKTDRGSWVYEDFGGKSEDIDTCIKDTAFREFLQETNCTEADSTIFNTAFLDMQLTDKRSIIYPIQEYKYMLYIIYVSPQLKNHLKLEDFDVIEKHDNIKRTVLWLSYKEIEEFSDEHIHPRILGFKQDIALIMAKCATGNHNGMY